MTDDVSAATGELGFVIGIGFEQEVEFAVVLETDNVLAPEGDFA